MLINFIVDMRRDVQDIFRMTPHQKQVMMFSATLSKEIRPVCKKFMQDVRAHSRPHPSCVAVSWIRSIYKPAHSYSRKQGKSKNLPQENHIQRNMNFLHHLLNKTARLSNLKTARVCPRMNFAFRRNSIEKTLSTHLSLWFWLPLLVIPRVERKQMAPSIFA